MAEVLSTEQYVDRGRSRLEIKVRFADGVEKFIGVPVDGSSSGSLPAGSTILAYAQSCADAAEVAHRESVKRKGAAA